MRDDPVETGDDPARRSAAPAVEHLDRNDCGGFRDAVGGARNRSGDMGAVPVAVVRRGICRGCCRVPARGCSTVELGVRRQKAGIDDVGRNATAGSCWGEQLVQGKVKLIGSIQTPRRTALGTSWNGCAAAPGCRWGRGSCRPGGVPDFVDVSAILRHVGRAGRNHAI